MRLDEAPLVAMTDVRVRALLALLATGTERAVRTEEVAA